MKDFTHRSDDLKADDELALMVIDEALQQARADVAALEAWDGGDPEEQEALLDVCYANLKRTLTAQQMTRAVLLLVQKEQRS